MTPCKFEDGKCIHCGEAEQGLCEGFTYSTESLQRKEIERLENEAVAWGVTVDNLRAELERLETHLTEMASEEHSSIVGLRTQLEDQESDFDTCMLHNVELQKELAKIKTDYEIHKEGAAAVGLKLLKENAELRAELKNESSTCGSGAGCLHKEATIDALREEWAALHQHVPVFLAAGAQPVPEAKNIATAPDCLNTNDKAMWVTGWNECREAMLKSAKVKP